MNKIWNFIKSLDIKTITLLFIEAIIFVAILAAMNNCNGRRIEILDQNLNAEKSNIETIMLSNGNLVAERDSYILKNKQLEEILDITKEEKKELEKKLDDKIAYIANIESNIKVDTLEVHDTVTIKDSSSITINFNYNDPWLNFSGGTYYKNGKSKTQIFDINIPTPLRVGLTDNYTIFVESKNPYLNITDIEGAVLDGSKLYPKERHWKFGLYAGVGLQYGLVEKHIDFGPQIGGGVLYIF